LFPPPLPLLCVRDESRQSLGLRPTAVASPAATLSIGNEGVPIQLAQCCFPGLAISNAKISIHLSNKIYGSNFIMQHSGTAMVEITKMPIAV